MENSLPATYQHPLLLKLKKFWQGALRLREANKMSRHFDEYFMPVLAQDIELKNTVYSIRHQVYCAELGFEPCNEAQMEHDDFDAYSFHALLQHKGSKTFAGTVRVVAPQTEEQLLPIEKYCIDSITHATLHPKYLPREKICEISRLAVPSDFRRRRADNFKGAATGVINQDNYSETELRCFPFIAVGLYLAAAAAALKNGIEHSYVMMEPRLARSMSFLGIKFEQIGPVVDYHGQRAPYYINQELFMKNLSPGFKHLLKTIINDLD